MKSYTTELVSMLQNSSINITLTGWPAAVSILAVCAASIGICALNVSYSRPNKEVFSYPEANAA